MSVEQLNHEARVRRMAQRQGLTLQKSRSRTPEDYSYGTYQLVDERNCVVCTGDLGRGYGLTLEEVEAALAEGSDA